MNRTIRAHIQRRRLQRWLRREARLLAREAELFGCVDARHEAHQLVELTRSPGFMSLRSA